MHHAVSGRLDGAETVLLSSGLGGVGAYWAPQLPALEARFRVVTYDQRGTGRTGGTLDSTHDIAAMAQDALAVLDASGTARAHVVGHALGGLIALDMARLAPDRVASMILVNAWARLDPHTARCFAVRSDLLRHCGVAAAVRAQPIFLYPASWLADHADRVAEEERHGIAHFQGAETWLQRVAAASAFDITADAPAIPARTLVMAGRDDTLVPVQASERLAALLPSAELWVAPYGGHAVNVTEPEVFNAAVLAFLAETELKPGPGPPP